MGAALAAERPSLGAVRAWWRVQHPPPSVAHRLDVAYTATLTVAVVGALGYGTASSALTDVLTPGWVASIAPGLALMALVVAAHWGVYQGPAVFTVPDVANLLASPLSRRVLVARRLLRAFGIASAAAIAVVALMLVGLAGHGRGVEPVTVAGSLLAAVEIGVLGVCLGWAVQSSARWERAVRRLSWGAALLAAAFTVLARTNPDRLAANHAGWLLALGALTVATGVAARFVARTAAGCSSERHMRRAEGRIGAIASAMSFDARSARQSLAAVAARPDARVATELRALRAVAARLGGSALPIAWRSAVAARRMPGRTLESMALAAAGTWLWVASADRPLVIGAGLLLVYAAAARLLGPLRTEFDVKSRTRVLLRPRLGVVVQAHAIVPALLVTFAAAGAAAGAAAAGVIPTHAALVAVAAVATIPAIVCCAGMASRRGGRLPQSVVAVATMGDPSGGALAFAAWIAAWPTIAIAVAVIPTAAIHASGSGGASFATIWIGLVTAGLIHLLGMEPSEG